MPVTNPTTITASIQITTIDVMTMGQAEGNKIHRGTVVADTLTTTTFKFKVTTAKIAIDAIIILMSEITDAATMTLESGPGHVIIASSPRKIVAVNHAHSIFISTIMISK